MTQGLQEVRAAPASREDELLRRSFVRFLRAEGRSPTTVQRYELSVRQSQENLPRPYTADEVRAMLRVCQGKDHHSFRDRAIILALVDTGLRASEFCSLKVSDVNRNGEHIIARGNLATEGTHSYEYDMDNRLESISGAAQYTYDGQGNLVKRTMADGSWTVYIGGIYEKRSDGTYVKYYSAFGRRIATRDNARVLNCILADHLGSSTIVTSSAGDEVRSGSPSVATVSLIPSLAYQRARPWLSH